MYFSLGVVQILNSIIKQIDLKSDTIIVTGSLVAIFVAIYGGMIAIGKKIDFILKRKLQKYQIRELGSNINEETKKTLKYYIPTRGQDVDPCNAEEIVDSRQYISRLLVPFLMRNDFDDDKNRRYIILADSGMGKTTFLYNLFISYYKKILRKHSISFVSLYSNDVLKKIEEIDNKLNTILLLDGLDENRKAMENCKDFLDKIYNATYEFHTVIITCRTQFFGSEEDEPSNIDVFSGNTFNKKPQFEKIYLSPFNEREIEIYLKKKYKFFWNKDKLKRAKKIVKNCTKLMVRPMLLAYMDDLIADETVEYKYTYEIYNELVKKWIEREGNETLNDFSEKVAEKMYNEGTIYIGAKEIENLCQEYNIKIKSIEAKSRSLLNRNSQGIYKFSHKSILEFILAKKTYSDVEFRKIVVHYGFDEYDMMGLFLKEMCKDYLYRLLKKNNNWVEDVSFSFFQLPDIKFYNISFDKCDFEYCVLTDVKFVNVYLCNINFTNANLQRVCFNDVVLENINMRKCNLKNAILKKVKLNDVDLSGANLEGAHLEGADLTNALLICADLEGAHLEGADLMSAALICTNLKGAHLEGANLRGAKLKDMRMKNLKNAYLNGSYWMINDVKKMIHCFVEARFEYIHVQSPEGMKVIYKRKLLNYIENIM